MCNIKNVTRYIGLSLINKGLSIGPLKLQRILYYAQSWDMVIFDRNKTLFAQAPQAWVNGPVYPKIYYEYRDKVPNICDYLNETNSGTDSAHIDKTLQELTEKLSFLKGRIELLDSVFILYGSKLQNDLIFLTHSEKPWVEARDSLNPFQCSGKSISLDTICSFYKNGCDGDRKHHEAQ